MANRCSFSLQIHSTKKGEGTSTQTAPVTGLQVAMTGAAQEAMTARWQHWTISGETAGAVSAQDFP